KDENDQRKKHPIDSTLLGIKRGVEECKKLTEMASALPAGSQEIALLDGTLVVWGLEAYPGFVASALLQKEFLPYFDRIRNLNDTRSIALASYISLPRSSEVVNALRVAICPQEIPNCDQCPETDGVHACDIVSGVQDYKVFSEILKNGERSALFYSQSRVVNEHYGQNAIYFFYLRVDDEIARIEVPEWVVRDKGGALLDLAHSLALDQCRRGQGYPVALSEAHEKAVVTGADREEFWRLVEQSMEEEKLPADNSIKSRSKRTRWI
ncbi:MAG: DNA double-strand break repair nuclease NurA, partial [Dehalococcoidales bacterium]|nr:DNA double-strand break repair nuclease NurA [Dehalococcoidales bacterium]